MRYKEFPSLLETAPPRGRKGYVHMLLGIHTHHLEQGVGPPFVLLIQKRLRRSIVLYSGAFARQFWREFILSYCELIFTWLPVPALPLVSPQHKNMPVKYFPPSFEKDFAVPRTP